MSYLLWSVAVVVGAAGIFVGTLLVRSYLTTGSPTAALFRPRPERRLGIVETTHVDARRRLVLVRRDDVEHLIMIGGPIDMLIEQKIEREPLPVHSLDEAGDEPEVDIANRPHAALDRVAGEH